MRCDKIVIMWNEILREFGKVILTEMKQIFEEGSNVVIPFTEDSIREICAMYELDFNEVKTAFNVGFVNCGVDDYYISLACCVFQVMVAYDCLAKASNSYNDKLAHFIQFSVNFFGESELQDTYAEEFYRHGNAKKQELLWEGAQRLLETNGLHLRIPERTFYSGRYVQYPLKQRIINRKTLKKYIDNFKKKYNNRIDEAYSFETFSNELFKNTNIVHSDENCSLLDLKEANRIAKRIVFYCFCNWVEHESRTKTKKKKDVFKVKLSNGVFTLFVNGNKVQTVTATIPKRPFVYDETYDEWVLSYSDISQSEDGTIGVLLDYSDWGNNSLLKDAPDFIWEYSKWKKFYINPTQYILRQKDWLKKDNIKFVGGVKDNSDSWILTLLPTITNINGQNSIVVDHKSYTLKEGTLDLNTILGLGEGIHVIRLFDRSPILFKVVALNKNYNIQRGWTWKKRESNFISTEEECILSGLYANVPISLDKSRISWGNTKMERLNNKYDKIGLLTKLGREI